MVNGLARSAATTNWLISAVARLIVARPPNKRLGAAASDPIINTMASAASGSTCAASYIFLVTWLKPQTSMQATIAKATSRRGSSIWERPLVAMERTIAHRASPPPAVHSVNIAVRNTSDRPGEKTCGGSHDEIGSVDGMAGTTYRRGSAFNIRRGICAVIPPPLASNAARF